MKRYINILNLYNIPLFEYLYIFVMIIYMGQMTIETQRMSGTLSGNPIPFLIPIFFTIYLLKKHNITFKNKELLKIFCIITTWNIIHIIYFQDYSISSLSFLFFLYYAIIIAYIHTKIYKIGLFYIYEDIVVKLSIIGLIIWSIAILFPNIIQPFFRTLPDTTYGHNLLYIYNLMDPIKGQVGIVLRNAGFSWEPGRYAICLLPAIWINLCRNGIKFKHNRNIIILLLSIFSTQSTTGLSITIIIYTLFFIKKISIKSIILIFLFIMPSIYLISQIDFMGEKISKQLDLNTQITTTEEHIVWAQKELESNELHVSLDRFLSAYYECINISKHPILGYGLDFTKAYFYTNITTNFNLTGGLLQIIGKFGIIIGLYLYYILLKSSFYLNKRFNDLRDYSIFIIIIGSSISYPILGVPIFTTIWFYGFFNKNNI